MRAFAVALLALTSLAALADSSDAVTGPVALGDLKGVMVMDNLYMGAQPSPDALAAARTEGVEVVVNLRTQGEMTFDELQAAQQNGMYYYHVPIAGANGFNASNLAQLNALMRTHSNQKILVHCASGNRVGGWLAANLIAEQGVAPDEAFAAARKAGLRSDQIETHLRQLLKQQ